MSFKVIIPARYASERFPGKPLIDIKGKPMIERVHESAAASKASSVCIATDDKRVASAVAAFGGECVMTRPDHPSGTDRVHEAAHALGMKGHEVIVNLQGDEPLMPAEAIDQVAEAIAGQQVQMATLCEPITRAADLFDPGVVKVVRDEQQRARYFSRAPVPWDRNTFTSSTSSPAELPENGHWFRHLGIYAYTYALLDDFVRWPPAMMEEVECLEQLRVVEKGINIHVGQTSVPIPPGVDTPEDLARLMEFL